MGYKTRIRETFANLSRTLMDRGGPDPRTLLKACVGAMEQGRKNLLEKTYVPNFYRVYMRGKDAIGVAVRGPDGQIFAGQEKLDSVLHRNRFARTPFFRGIVVLYETLVIGTKWLMRSGSLAAAGEGVAFGGEGHGSDQDEGRQPGSRRVERRHALVKVKSGLPANS